MRRKKDQSHPQTTAPTTPDDKNTTNTYYIVYSFQGHNSFFLNRKKSSRPRVTLSGHKDVGVMDWCHSFGWGSGAIHVMCLQFWWREGAEWRLCVRECRHGVAGVWFFYHVLYTRPATAGLMWSWVSKIINTASQSTSSSTLSCHSFCKLSLGYPLSHRCWCCGQHLDTAGALRVITHRHGNMFVQCVRSNS